MQYLLNESEYQEFHRKKAERTAAQKEELQALCMLAANHVPVKIEWCPDDEAEPWGCILNKDGNGHDYCDFCPARNICPYEGKKWSK